MRTRWGLLHRGGPGCSGWAPARHGPGTAVGSNPYRRHQPRFFSAGSSPLPMMIGRIAGSGATSFATSAGGASSDDFASGSAAGAAGASTGAAVAMVRSPSESAAAGSGAVALTISCADAAAGSCVDAVAGASAGRRPRRGCRRWLERPHPSLWCAERFEAGGNALWFGRRQDGRRLGRRQRRGLGRRHGRGLGRPHFRPRHRQRLARHRLLRLLPHRGARLHLLQHVENIERVAAERIGRGRADIDRRQVGLLRARCSERRALAVARLAPPPPAAATATPAPRVILR